MNGADGPGATSVPSRTAASTASAAARGLRLGSIERPERRARARQPDRAVEQPAQRALERDELGDDQRGRRQQVVGRGEHAGPRDEVRGRQLGPQLLGEVRPTTAGRRRRPGRGWRRTRRTRRASGRPRPASRARPRARRGGRAAARPARRGPRPAPARRRGRTGRPSRAGRRARAGRRRRARRPTPRAHRRRSPRHRTSRRPARPRPGSACRGGRRAPVPGPGPPAQPPPTAARAAASARSTRLSSGGPASRPGHVERVAMAARSAPG